MSDIATTSISSREALISTAKELFWNHGIKRITVEEICEHGSVSKMTFYRNFKNKEEIALAVIELMTDQSRVEYRAIMSSEISFREKVAKIIELKAQNSQGISKALVLDIYSGKIKGLQTVFEKMQRDMLSEIMEDFRIAQKNGDLRKDLNLNFVLYMLNDIKDKLTDDKLNSIYQNEQELIMELTNFFFYGILVPTVE